MTHPSTPPVVPSNVSGASVEAQAVSQAFAGQLVVDRVNLKIAPGEFVALLGPSGCGKSTFLRLVADLDRPSGGTLTLGAGQAATGNPAQADRFFRSFVFQEAQLVPWRSALRNVMLPLELMGVSKDKAQARARAALEQVGLIEARDRYPLELSGGMKMRVSVARALVTEPRLLLLDEPFAALDENTRHALQSELRRIWEKTGMTVLFVTHSVSEAVFLANRIVVFSKRPARILYDQPVLLPSPRELRIRTDARFSDEMKKIYANVSEAEAPL